MATFLKAVSINAEVGDTPNTTGTVFTTAADEYLALNIRPQVATPTNGDQITIRVVGLLGSTTLDWVYTAGAWVCSFSGGTNALPLSLTNVHVPPNSFIDILILSIAAGAKSVQFHGTRFKNYTP